MAIPLAVMLAIGAGAGAAGGLFGGRNNSALEASLPMLQRLYDRAMGGDGDAMQSLFSEIARIQGTRADTAQNTADLSYSAPYPGGYWDSQNYTPEERDAIMQAGGLQSLLPSEDELAQMGLTHDEIVQIMGDPYSAFNFFGEQAGRAQGDQEGFQSQLYDTLGAIDRPIRSTVERIGQRGSEAISRYADPLHRLAYNPDLLQRGDFLSDIKSAVNDPRTSLDPRFAQDYAFSDKDMSDLEYLANRAVGERYSGAMEDVRRRAAAAGATNPLAQAALSARLLSQAAADAGDSATGARVTGRREQLDRMRDKEGLRLSAEQANASRRLSGLTQAEQIRLSAQANQANLARGVEEGLLGNELGLNQLLGQLGMNAEQFLASANLDTITNAAKLRQALDQSIMEGGSRLLQTGESNASDRARGIALNRQDTARYVPNFRFNTGLQVNDRLSDRAKGIANERLNFERERRGYNANSASQANSNWLNAAGMAGNFWNSRGSQALGAANAIRGVGSELAGQPSRLERGISTGLGVLSGLGPFAGNRTGTSRTP